MIDWPPPAKPPVWCPQCGQHHNVCRFCGEALAYGPYGKMNAHGPGPHCCEIDVAAILGPCNETMYRQEEPAPLVIEMPKFRPQHEVVRNGDSKPKRQWEIPVRDD